MRRRIALLAASGIAVASLAVGFGANALAEDNPAPDDASTSSLPVCNDTATAQTSMGGVVIPSHRDNGFDCIMGVGASGIAVKNLQQHLNDCYGPATHRDEFDEVLDDDGVFGTKTRDALWAVQDRAATVDPDGIYGPQTRDGILWFAGFDAYDCRPLS